jgi:hypothetical protein
LTTCVDRPREAGHGTEVASAAVRGTQAAEKFETEAKVSRAAACRKHSDSEKRSLSAGSATGRTLEFAGWTRKIHPRRTDFVALEGYVEG